jgi:hypothetical protein
MCTKDGSVSAPKQSIVTFSFPCSISLFVREIGGCGFFNGLRRLKLGTFYWLGIFDSTCAPLGAEEPCLFRAPILQVWPRNSLKRMLRSLLFPYTGFVLPHLHSPLLRCTANSLFYKVHFAHKFLLFDTVLGFFLRSIYLN